MAPNSKIPQSWRLPKTGSEGKSSVEIIMENMSSLVFIFVPLFVCHSRLLTKISGGGQPDEGRISMGYYTN